MASNFCLLVYSLVAISLLFAYDSPGCTLRPFTSEPADCNDDICDINDAPSLWQTDANHPFALCADCAKPTADPQHAYDVTVDSAHGSATTEFPSAMSTMARPPMYSARKVVRGAMAMAMDEVVRPPPDAIPALLGPSRVSSNIEETDTECLHSDVPEDGVFVEHGISAFTIDDNDDSSAPCENIAPDAQSLLFGSADDGHSQHSAKECVADSVNDDSLAMDTDLLARVADVSPAVSTVWKPALFSARKLPLKAQPLSDEGCAIDPNVCDGEVSDVTSHGINVLVGLSFIAVLSAIIMSVSMKDYDLRAIANLAMAFMSVVPIVAVAAFDLSEPQLSLNQFDTCFVQYGEGVCWGRNQFGQLGRGDTASFGDDANDLLLPLNPIDFGEDFIVKQIAGGAHFHHCASSVDGRCKCFGYNTYGLSMR